MRDFVKNSPRLEIISRVGHPRRASNPLPTPLAPFFAIAPRNGVITPFHTRTPLLPGIKLASHQTLLTTVKL